MAAYPIGTPYAGSSASPAYTGIFIPAVWAGKFIEKFYDATVLGAIASTDYEGEIKNYGDTINIRTHPAITISPYQVDQALVVQRPSSSLVSLQINQGAYFNTVLDDVMQIQADVDLLSVWADNATEQMKVYVDTLILAYGSIALNVAAANARWAAGRLSGSVNLGASTNEKVTISATAYFGAPLYLGRQNSATGTGNAYGITGVAAGSGLNAASYRGILDFIIDCGLVLDEQRAPETGRWLVLPAWAAALIKRSAFQQAYLTGDAVSIARNGRIGMIDRFTVYVSNLLPVGTGAGAGTAGTATTGTLTASALAVNEYGALFGHNMGLSFASQMTKVETLRSESTFGTLMRGLQIWGFSVINGTLVGAAVIANSGQ